MIMQLPPAQMANRDGDAGMGDYALGYQHHLFFCSMLLG